MITIDVKACHHLQTANQIEHGINEGLARYGQKVNAQLYLAGIHRFVLQNDGVDTSEFCEMTGRAAKLTNIGLRSRFIQSVANSRQEPLQHWRVVERFIRETPECEEIREREKNRQLDNLQARLLNKAKKSRRTEERISAILNEKD